MTISKKPNIESPSSTPSLPDWPRLFRAANVTCAFCHTMSIAKAEGRPRKYGWEKWEECDIEELARPEHGLVKDQHKLLCPAKFENLMREDQGCRRTIENLLGVYGLGLDFDGPRAPGLVELVETLGKFRGLAYTTRSHGKAKGGVTCDRYRVFLQYSRPVTHPENKRIHNLLGMVMRQDRKSTRLNSSHYS